MEKQITHFVVVVGAGPAGLFAARELAEHGTFIVLLNRDIKPGGLAEYGIYPDKHKMKQGLRSHFHLIVTNPNIEYYGNILVGDQGDITLKELAALGAQAILVAVGAQGTKWLGLPGEKLSGVYHAKDIVYHYNLLPPFSEMPFRIGKRVAVIGAGNVSLDIANWLIQTVRVDEVVAVIRRGPEEVKFDKTQLEYVSANLDLQALDAEFSRVEPVLKAVDQDTEISRNFLLSGIAKAAASTSPSRLRMRFLSSPTRILGDGDGRVKGLEVENNSLAGSNGSLRAVGTGVCEVLDVDTVIFAIGDHVDDHVGLPVDANEFIKNPNPRFPVDGNSYETCDPARSCILENCFVAGWSRKASQGLVGVARKDGVNGAKAVLAYLETMPSVSESFLGKVGRVLAPKAVGKQALFKLEEVETQIASSRGLEEFKFSRNEDMLAAIELGYPSILKTVDVRVATDADKG